MSTKACDACCSPAICADHIRNGLVVWRLELRHAATVPPPRSQPVNIMHKYSGLRLNTVGMQRCQCGT
eukprot:3432018-Amphidinium_carterae.1